jgi:hypothetical protein
LQPAWAPASQHAICTGDASGVRLVHRLDASFEVLHVAIALRLPEVVVDTGGDVQLVVFGDAAVRGCLRLFIYIRLGRVIHNRADAGGAQHFGLPTSTGA